MQQDKFVEIIKLIKQSRTNAIKAVNAELINLYWNIGAYISKKIATSSWGEKTVDELAEYIHHNYPELKGFNRRGLYRMKQFYDTYTTALFMSPRITQPGNKEKVEIVSAARTQLKRNVEIVPPPRTQLEIQDIRDSILSKLSWTHHRTIFSRCKTIEEMEFYIKLSIKEGYSFRELDRQISAGLFERRMIGNTKFSTALKELPWDVTNGFKDSYIFEFLNLPELHSESDLQKGLITQMKNFILELGKDFLFVGEEYKLLVGNSDFYIDLLFFHRELQCLVAFELKSDKFKPEHLGQLNFYLEALDHDVKKQNENLSIGILLCKDKDNEVVEYALNRTLSPTMVAEYKTQLPDKKLLQQKIRELFENSALFAEE
jgi:predicted nuclease of restriction endonuclease-like (RecB) superfamily